MIIKKIISTRIIIRNFFSNDNGEIIGYKLFIYDTVKLFISLIFIVSLNKFLQFVGLPRALSTSFCLFLTFVLLNWRVFYEIKNGSIFESTIIKKRFKTLVLPILLICLPILFVDNYSSQNNVFMEQLNEKFMKLKRIYASWKFNSKGQFETTDSYIERRRLELVNAINKFNEENKQVFNVTFKSTHGASYDADKREVYFNHYDIDLSNERKDTEGLLMNVNSIEPNIKYSGDRTFPSAAGFKIVTDNGCELPSIYGWVGVQIASESFTKRFFFAPSIYNCSVDSAKQIIKSSKNGDIVLEISYYFQIKTIEDYEYPDFVLLVLIKKVKIWDNKNDIIYYEDSTEDQAYKKDLS